MPQAAIRVLMFLVLAFAMAIVPMSPSAARTAGKRVLTGAAQVVASDFSVFAGKRVGLITNQTGVVGDTHLADLMAASSNIKLAGIYAPEHGFRGGAEAGVKFDNTVDGKTGVQIFSLYGKTRKPTRAMLQGIDVMVFDIQDVGARFYTYISTMGLAMQAAAEAGIPFVVLDRPNPLGGDYVSGYVLEKRHKSFVGQYPIPIVHGLTVGELAQMIVGENYLPGLAGIDLKVVRLQGWQRTMRWDEVDLEWISPSPNIPTFISALVYPGIGVVGMTTLNEGRGTAVPFSRFGAPWVDHEVIARQLNDAGLPGVTFKPVTYVPRSIPNVALDPAYRGKKVNGIEIEVTDVARYLPLEVGMYAMALMRDHARTKGGRQFFKNLRMFHLIAGTRRFHNDLKAGKSAAAIIESWSGEVARFRQHRAKYLLY
ncbi:MAG: DUF1343 domain-containing protein [Alphaproteobacteria bacterium]|nr:DUF1343 domain-containing protein [Alphaproteobacteria bacterium]